MRIEGTRVLVTGAARGIGAATARLLAARGASTLILADIDDAALADTAAAVQEAGASAMVRTVDVSQPDAVIRLFEDAEAESGGLDVVHNNAGIMAGGPDFPDTPVERLVAVIQVNLIAMMVGTRQAIEIFRRAGRPGVIVNTASVAGFRPMPADPAYSASKAGIINFTESCAPLKEAFGIRVMAVCPGMVDTGIVPHDAEWLKPALAALKMLEPVDIAEAVCGVIEDDDLAGSYVTVENEPAAG